MSAPQLLAAISQGVERAKSWYSSQLKELPPAPMISATLPLEHQAARVLAYAALPLTAPEIVTQLAAHKIEVRAEQARDMLGRSPIFVPVARWYWQLGL